MAAPPEPTRPRIEALEGLASVMESARQALNDGPSRDGCWVEIPIDHWDQIHDLLNELLQEPITTEAHHDGGSDDTTAHESGEPGTPDPSTPAIDRGRPRRRDPEYQSTGEPGATNDDVGPDATLRLLF